MAATHWYTGRNSESTATVIVRSAANESITVIANGQSLEAVCATAVNDGNALVEFTGLSPGQRYPFTVGGVAGGEIRAKPTGLPMWLAFTSCWNISSIDIMALRILSPPTTGPSAALLQECYDNLAGFFALGDLVYMNQTGTTNGYAMTKVDSGTLANGKSVEVRRQYYRAGRQHAGLRELMREVPTYLLKDDHEYDPDNACYSIDWLTRQYGGSPTQTDLDEVWTAASTGWRDWVLGNPAKEVVTGVLGGPDCYRVRIGPVEVWCTDLIHERDDHALADGPDKHMMSAAQEEWLLSTMGQSPAQFKIWACSKQFVSSVGRNADGWFDLPSAASAGYQTQLQRILADPRFPRAGALSITGDEHVRSDAFIVDGRFGGSHAAISQMAAGPATIEVITDPDDGMTYRDGIRDKERDQSGISFGGYSARGENNYGLLRVLPDRIERYVLGSRYGLRYMGYVGVQDNLVRR